MAKAKVLYVHMTGVASEVCKNLVLAGIRACICDERPYPDAVQDCPSFFLSANKVSEPSPKKAKMTVAQAMQSKIEELNPLLGDCEIVEKSVSELEESFLSQFCVVVASRLSKEQAVRLAKATVAAGSSFYLVDSFGMQGVCAIDLGSKFAYRPEKGKELLEWTTLEKYTSLEDMLKVPLSDVTNRFHKTPPPIWVQYRCLLEAVDKLGGWPTEDKASDLVDAVRPWLKKTAPSLLQHETVTDDSLWRLAKVATAEVAPVCSVLGGLVGNEVIKAISGKGTPVNNTLQFDGETSKGLAFLVEPCKKVEN
jgi:ubiquitin-like 1-activating enzyme E1 A